MAGGGEPLGMEAVDKESFPERPLRPEDLGIGQLFWAMRDAVVVGDAATGRIVLWNPAAEALFGYTAAEALGRLIEILVPAALKDRHRAGLASFAATGSGVLIDAGAPVELPALRKGGDVITIELSLTPIERAIVPGRFVLAIVRDATERTRAEAERLELAREHAARAEAEAALRARDQFLSIAAHELRNPVMVLTGAAQLLQRTPADATLAAQRQERLLQQITKAAERLAELTDDLLDISRIQLGQLPLHPERVNLTEIVHDFGCRYLEQLEAHHQLEIKVPATPAFVVVDPSRLEQVLVNLLDNAVKYSPDGGLIELALRPENGGSLIQVRDQGIGLPPGTAEAIFEPFGRADNTSGIPGMGLGLFICRNIVGQHGGRIWAESAGKGRGTTVHVRLPRDGELGEVGSLLDG
jgi:PAS domain S-box-containing protein